MANITINNYCNLQCPYCFADVIKTLPEQNMSIEEYQSVLSFLNGQEGVSILGGEPTLHPQLNDILEATFNYCKEYDQGMVLFTNGANLDKYLPQLAQYRIEVPVEILINCNSPAIQSDEGYSDFLELLSIIFSDEQYFNMVDLGCNIYPTCSDYSFFWDIIETFEVAYARVSVVSPGGQFVNCRSNKVEFFTQIKPIFMNFINDAIKHELHINFDCGFLPRCYLTAEELELVQQASNIYPNMDVCLGVPVDILIGGKAIPCFGNYHSVDYDEFSDIQMLRHYFNLKTNYDAWVQNDDGACAECKKFEQFACQGGCLGFSKLNQ